MLRAIAGGVPSDLYVGRDGRVYHKLRSARRLRAERRVLANDFRDHAPDNRPNVFEAACARLQAMIDRVPGIETITATSKGGTSTTSL